MTFLPFCKVMLHLHESRQLKRLSLQEEIPLEPWLPTLGLPFLPLTPSPFISALGEHKNWESPQSLGLGH